MTGAETEPNRASVLFNNRHLAVVVEAIASHSAVDFTTRQLAQACGVADSLVRAVLHRLLGAGMIREHARRGGTRGELLYRVQDDAGWDLLVALCSQLAQDPRLTPIVPSGHTGMVDR